MKASSIPPFGLRMQPEMHERIKADAAKNHRSMNAEILYRLGCYERAANLGGGKVDADVSRSKSVGSQKPLDVRDKPEASEQVMTSALLAIAERRAEIDEAFANVRAPGATIEDHRTLVRLMKDLQEVE